MPTETAPATLIPADTLKAKWYLLLVNVHQRKPKSAVDALKSVLNELRIKVATDDPVNVSPVAWAKADGVQQLGFFAKLLDEEMLILSKRLRENSPGTAAALAPFGESVMQKQPVRLNASLLRAPITEKDGKPDPAMVRATLKVGYSLEVWEDKR